MSEIDWAEIQGEDHARDRKDKMILYLALLIPDLENETSATIAKNLYEMFERHFLAKLLWEPKYQVELRETIAKRYDELARHFSVMAHTFENAQKTQIALEHTRYASGWTLAAKIARGLG